MKRAFACLGSLLCVVRVCFATDVYREPWNWTSEFPALRDASPARPTRQINRFRFGARSTMAQVVAACGSPSSFAPQYPVTRTEGVPVGLVAGSGPEAGTFRYAMPDGGEVFVCVRDLHTITAVIRFRRSGQRDDLYRRADA